jgi:anti-sigma-K factor RskA
VTSRTALSHEQIHELLGAHAVDAVDADEQAAIDEHLETCDACRLEVDRHRATLTLLVEPVDPAAALRQRVVEAATSGAPAPVVAMDEARRSRERARAPRRRVGVALGIGAAAAVVLVAVLGFAVGRRNAPTPDLQALATQAQGQPGSRQVTLRSPDGSVDAQVTQTADGTGYVESEQLPPLSAGQTYQLWAFSGPDGQTPISLGVLGADPNVSTFRADATVTGFAISKEAAGGAVAPTAPIVSGKV